MIFLGMCRSDPNEITLPPPAAAGAAAGAAASCMTLLAPVSGSNPPETGAPSVTPWFACWSIQRAISSRCCWSRSLSQMNSCATEYGFCP